MFYELDDPTGMSMPDRTEDHTQSR